MSDPSFRPLFTGDTADDDGQVIDSLVEQAATPPTPPVEPVPATPLVTPKAPNRLLSVRQTLDPTWDSPTMLLPDDLGRKSLHVSVSAPSSVTGYSVADPGPGNASWTVTVPDGEVWEVISVREGLQTTAVTASRIPEITFTTNDDNVRLATSTATTSLPASSFRIFSWIVGGGGNTAGAISSALPERLVLASGYKIKGTVYNYDVGDTLSSIVITYRVVSGPGVAFTSERRGVLGLAVLGAGESMTIDHYTGALYAKALGTVSVTVNAWDVTE